MKKFFVLALILLCPIMLLGCSNNSDLEDNMSEITKIYYQGNDLNNEVVASISVGQREIDYSIDGIHEDVCDFSLVVVNFNKIFDEDTIKVMLSINGETMEFEMYYNPVNHFYMNDIGYALGENDEISLSYQDYNILFNNVSKNFSIDWKEALEIAKNSLEERLNSFYQSGNFKGECYLKILTEQDENFEDLFWYFSAVSQNGEVLNVVINVENGNVLVD